MEQNSFYKHVSSWIRSYRTPDMLEGLRTFVDSSAQPAEVKEQLYREIDYKERILTQKPSFTNWCGTTWLANEEGNPKVYVSRFTAVCKLAELTLKGYEVELYQADDTYRITLTPPAPMSGIQVAA